MNANKVQTLILPIVPKGIKLPTSTNIENYEGIEKPYSLPDYKKLVGQVLPDKNKFS